MRRGFSGEYSTRQLGGETVNAFVPQPLPPCPAPEIRGARARRHEQALLACGRLDSITQLLPEPDLFLYAYIRREALVSSQIEGTQSSLSDLLLFELDEVPGVPFDDVVEVSNYIAAMNHGLERLRGGFPLSNRLLCEMHARLLARGRGARMQPGAFRRSQNWIGGTRPGNARFVPAPPEYVQDVMASLEAFLHEEELPFSALIKAALAHVQFETIHPFLDGNGRIGRLLIALTLHQDGVLREPLLYLSLYLKQHRMTYYELLDGVRYDGDWEAWLDFFLEGVQVTATGAVDTADRLVTLFREDAQQIQNLGRASANTLRVFDALRSRPVASIKDLRRRSDLSAPTVGRAVDALEEMGVVDEITGRQRDRVYVYRRYLNILNEGAEPL
ncbi:MULTISPECIES: Fic family protein [Spiribacter]|uniref:Fic family protein n=1 Tax=Spiribacter TaxID=1335745 RepID=UPI00132F80F9|nr:MULTISPECIES: Fic family protein [Spiribacter]KAF0283786.1 cell filamentation protein Fic [Spiribacter roseus]KAF0285025.1 cell filamentation protein Fic [Spiribacter sp. SSL99]